MEVIVAPTKKMRVTTNREDLFFHVIIMKKSWERSQSNRMNQSLVARHARAGRAGQLISALFELLVEML